MTTRINLTVDKATYERLRLLAFEQRTTIPEIIRQAIDKQLAEHCTDPAEITASK